MLVLISSLALAVTLPSAPPHTSASAEASLQSLISPDDYPAEALARNEQGTVGVILHVDPTGAVSRCHVEKSSGSVVLDTRTCELLQRRARFKPARDGNGRAFSTEIHSSVTWQLAGDHPPSESWAYRTVMNFAPDGRLVSCRVEVEGARKDSGPADCSDYPSNQLLHRAPKIEGLSGAIGMVVFEDRFVIGTTAPPPPAKDDMLFARQVLSLKVSGEGKLVSCQALENSGPESDAQACSAIAKNYSPRMGPDRKAAAFTATMVRSVYVRVETKHRLDR